MAINSEACATSGTPGVSAAKTSPEHQTHSVFVWQDGDRAYAVMVDNEEFEDVDIVDITDPRSPVLTKELDVTTLADIGTAFGDAVFLHDMVVKKIRGEPAVDGHNQRPQQRAALQRGKPDRPQRKDPRSPEELGPQTRFFGRGWRYRWAVPGSAGRRRQSGHGSHRRH
jgi:hypothetical protein